MGWKAGRETLSVEQSHLTPHDYQPVLTIHAWQSGVESRGGPIHPSSRQTDRHYECGRDQLFVHNIPRLPLLATNTKKHDRAKNKWPSLPATGTVFRVGKDEREGGSERQ